MCQLITYYLLLITYYLLLITYYIPPTLALIEMVTPQQELEGRFERGRVKARGVKMDSRIKLHKKVRMWRVREFECGRAEEFGSENL